MSDEMINSSKSFPHSQTKGIGDTNSISEEFDMNKLNDSIGKKSK